MRQKLKLFTLCLIASFTGFSQSTSTAYTPTDSIASLRNKTALAVVYTMYYQDSVIAVQKQKINTWESKYIQQKSYSDSCDATRNRCLGVVDGLGKSNQSLTRQNENKSKWLKISGVLNIVLIIAVLL